MSRSLKKGPYIEVSLEKKILAMNESGKKNVVKTWARASMISPDFVGHTVAVHNGNKFIPVYVTENMVGHKLGDALSLQEGFHFSKPFVSQIACRHLDADVLLQGMFLGGEMLDIEGDTCIAAKILDKFLISVGFFASEVKVGVQGFHQVPQIM